MNSKSREEGNESLLQPGWDRSWLKCLVMLSTGRFAEMSKINADPNHRNQGSMEITAEIMLIMNQDYLHNLSIVSHNKKLLLTGIWIYY